MCYSSATGYINEILKISEQIKHAKMSVSFADSYENLSRKTNRYNNDDMKVYEEMMAERMLSK